MSKRVKGCNKIFSENEPLFMFLKLANFTQMCESFFSWKYWWEEQKQKGANRRQKGKSCTDTAVVYAVKKISSWTRFFNASRVVAIKHDRATTHPAKHFYAVILMFELLPLVTFKCVIFHVESRNPDVYAELNVHFCHTISSQRLQQFHSGGMFCTVFLLGVCVGSQRDTD